MTAPQPPKTYGDQHKTLQEIQAMPAGQQREYLEQYMSPQDRYNYLQENATAQYQHDNAFIRFIEDLNAGFKAQQQAQTYGQQSVQQSTDSQTQYVTGLTPSSTDYQGIDHTQLQSYVDNGLDAGQIGSMSTGYHQMSSTFDQIATSLKDAVNKSQSEWEGNAADSARGYFSSLQTWADGNSQNARLASEVTYQQSTAASNAKNSMPAPIPFSWTDEMKSWASSNPLNLVDNIKASMDKAQQSQQAHDQAVQVMTSYDNSLYGAASKQPVFAEPPKFEAGGGAGPGQISGNIGSTQASGYTGPGSGSAGGGGGFSVPGGGGDAGSVSGTLNLSPGAKTGAISGSLGNTEAQGFRQQPDGSTPPPSSSAGNPNTLGPMGGMPMAAPMGGMGGGDDGSEYASKIGRGGGFGPGGGAGSGSGSGSAASSGSATGEGARTGMRAGGAGAAEAAGSAGARGAGGRNSTSGMGGVGRGGKGEGSEDEEHQRPSWLVEADPDEVFGSSERTAPPVIGE